MHVCVSDNGGYVISLNWRIIAEDKLKERLVELIFHIISNITFHFSLYYTSCKRHEREVFHHCAVLAPKEHDIHPITLKFIPTFFFACAASRSSDWLLQRIDMFKIDCNAGVSRFCQSEVLDTLVTPVRTQSTQMFQCENLFTHPMANWYINSLFNKLVPNLQGVTTSEA
jgi:hypothetical protein